MSQVQRRQFLFAAGALLAAPLACLAQRSSAGIPSVGLLWIKSDAAAQNFVAFRERLRELGFVEGQSVRFERRDEVPSYEQLPKAAVELAQLKVDVIFAWGDTATRAASKATNSIPIVMLVGSDPVAAGLAASLSRPGGNLTGITSLGQALVAKRLQLLKETVPGLERVAVLLNPTSQGEMESLKVAEAAARSLGMRLHVAEVRNAQDIEPVIATASRARAGALTALPSTCSSLYSLHGCQS